MTTSHAALSPVSKIAMITIWMESVLYGINCVMYCLCMFVLLRGHKTARARWVLTVISTILFLLCTVYIAISLRQLLEAFVYVPADIPHYTTTYWLSLTLTRRVLHGNVFATIVFAEELILIWRLYVVYMCNWKVAVLPIVLAAGCAGSAYAASFVLSKAGLFSPVFTSLAVLSWVCGTILSMFVTGGIVWQLWWTGRRVASLIGTPNNRFASSIYVVVESGAIGAVTDTTVLILFASKNPVALFSINVASQLVVLTPLLVVVQVALTDRHRTLKGNLSQPEPTAP